MADRGYWARLGQEAISDRPSDHPLGFGEGGMNGALLQRLAVLREELKNAAQRKAFDAVVGELGLFSRQMHDVLEGLRAVARDCKNMEDDVSHGDLQDLRERVRLSRRFDGEAYKRSTVAAVDLHKFAERGEFDPVGEVLYGGFDWERQALHGRDLNRRVVDRETRAKQQAKEQREADLIGRSTGRVYKIGPETVDLSHVRNERKDVPCAEKRLVAMGFEVTDERNVRSLTRAWRDLIVYGDPRRGGSLHFHVYRGAQRLETFWVKDKGDDPQLKLEAKLEKLQPLGTR